MAEEVSTTDLYRAVGRMEGKLDQFLSAYVEERVERGKRDDSIDDRLTSLETSRTRMRGIAAVVSVISSAVFTVVSSWFVPH